MLTHYTTRPHGRSVLIGPTHMVDTTQLSRLDFDRLCSRFAVTTGRKVPGRRLVWAIPEWLAAWGIRLGYWKEWK